MIGRAAAFPDIGRVVGADGGLHRAVAEQVALVQQLQVRGRHQHDVHDVLLHDGGDLVQELGAAAVARPGAVRLAMGSSPGEARPHVAVLGIRDDEIGALVLAGPDAGELGIQALHGINSAIARYFQTSLATRMKLPPSTPNISRSRKPRWTMDSVISNSCFGGT